MLRLANSNYEGVFSVQPYLRVYNEDQQDSSHELVVKRLKASNDMSRRGHCWEP
jgi:hypothetical protein